MLQLAEASAIRRSSGLKEIILGARISGRNQEAMRILEKEGYKKTYSFDLMEIELNGPPSRPVWPAGIQVRTFIPGNDEQVTYQADELASQDKRYHKPMSYDDWARRMALLLHSFGEFYHHGVHRVKLSVDTRSQTHAKRLYQRAGMQTTQQYHIYRKVVPGGNPD